MNKKFLPYIISLFITLSSISNPVYAETASLQFFTVTVLNSETGLFVGAPAIMTVTLKREGISHPATAGIYTSNQTFVLPTLEKGDIITVTVHKEGYKESESFVYTVNSETPKEGEVFHHIFYLETLIKPTLVQVIVKDVMGQPIKNADVKVLGIYADESFNGKTDENGNFSFYTRFENFKINVFAEGYKPFEGELKVSHEAPRMLYDVKLEFPSTKISVEVKDERWNPISGANVSFSSQYGSFNKITNNSGLAEFEIPSANYTLSVFKEGYLPHEESLDLSTPATMGKLIHLYPGVRLKLEIIDETGSPVSDVNITFVSELGNFTRTTNASGVVESEFPRANYTLSVSKKGYLPYEERLDLSKSATSTKIIQLIAETKPWWQQYWYHFIAGVVAICIAIPIIFKIRKKKTLTS